MIRQQAVLRVEWSEGPLGTPLLRVCLSRRLTQIPRNDRRRRSFWILVIRAKLGRVTRNFMTTMMDKTYRSRSSSNTKEDANRQRDLGSWARSETNLMEAEPLIVW